MLDLSNETTWKELLSLDPKLKELAIKAGVENNPKRAQELNGCFALNCGDEVVNSESERELASYLFGYELSSTSALIGRILMANEARENDL